MSFFSGLFKDKVTRDDICTAIISFCYGNMLALSNSNPKAFVETFSKDPTRSLKARIYSSSTLNACRTTPIDSLSMIKAKFIKLKDNRLLLLFDFSATGGIFTVNGGHAVAPSFVGMLFEQYLIKPPTIYFLEPSVEPGSTMLIRVTHNKDRINLGNGPYNTESHFIDHITNIGHENNSDHDVDSRLDNIDHIIINNCTEYTDIIDELRSFTENGKYAFGHGFYNTYKIFIDKYGSVDGFNKEKQKEKELFLSKIDAYTHKLKELDPIVALGARALFLCLEPMTSTRLGKKVTDRMLTVIVPLIPVD